jgi:predicted small lipoprotein YifL
MKKYLSFMLAVSVAASLTGCGNKESSSSSAPDSAVETTSVTEEITTTEPVTESESETTTQVVTTDPAPVEEVTSTEPVTENVTEEEKIPEAELPETTAEYAERISEQLEITDIMPMAASMIGAEEGTSFKYNGNKFELYRFNEGDPKLDEAASGSMTLTIEGFGDYEASTSVNGNYIMIYKNPDDTVISAFSSIK